MFKDTHQKRNLGSLLYAESFLIHHNAFKILTNNIPKFYWWETQYDWVET